MCFLIALVLFSLSLVNRQYHENSLALYIQLFILFLFITSFMIAAYTMASWVDPIGAIILSLYIIYQWSTLLLGKLNYTQKLEKKNSFSPVVFYFFFSRQCAKIGWTSREHR